ncbi:hypothetical protein A0H81_12746 [Grifola frondosa]|uniref:Ubiquitin 3 binding protein But2 C-terminal domain-containing protein n=1 Tax=Grifola frondosa TaxID=5627 RepID=A0A1C7LSC2_GRIFR|nr:hypothetical protein A0H81_12746 [Grifola frondosa]
MIDALKCQFPSALQDHGSSPTISTEMSPFSLAGKYLPLSSFSDDEVESEVSDATLTTSTRTVPSIGPWTVIICLACTFANIFVTVFYPLDRADLPTASRMTQKDIHHLRRPSQYIGLDEIARPSPPIPRQFDNYPILITQVDSAHREKVFDDDARAYMSRIGTITPEDRRVHVSNTVSSIIQFRAIDYGMEFCELRLRMEPGSSIAASMNTFMLNVYRLNATVPLDTTEVNYKTRPPRVAKVGVVEVNPTTETVWHERFFCLLDEVLTFELTCTPAADEEGCRAEWWQDKVDPRTAIFITQHSTV